MFSGFAFPSFSWILAAKSRRNMEIGDLLESVYSVCRICTSTTSFCNSAERRILATLLSSMRNLKTVS